MIRFKKHMNMIMLSLFAGTFSNAFSAEKKDKIEFVIKGEIDQKNSDKITNKIEELNQNNEKIKSEIFALQDKFISKNKGNNNIQISLYTDDTPGLQHYGIIQLTGSMNHIPLIRYDYPLLLEKKEKFPLFEGPVPLGEYEFHVRALVGLQQAQWPFVLPEGKWSIEKNIKIKAYNSGEKKDYQINLTADKETGSPQFVLIGEDNPK